MAWSKPKADIQQGSQEKTSFATSGFKPFQREPTSSWGSPPATQEDDTWTKSSPTRETDTWSKPALEQATAPSTAQNTFAAPVMSEAEVEPFAGEPFHQDWNMAQPIPIVEETPIDVWTSQLDKLMGEAAPTPAKRSYKRRDEWNSQGDSKPNQSPQRQEQPSSKDTRRSNDRSSTGFTDNRSAGGCFHSAEEGKTGWGKSQSWESQQDEKTDRALPSAPSGRWNSNLSTIYEESNTWSKQMTKADTPEPWNKRAEASPDTLPKPWGSSGSQPTSWRGSSIPDEKPQPKEVPPAPADPVQTEATEKRVYKRARRD